MKVSVLITTYNRPKYLKRVIEGHLAQSRVPDEIVIADDGSDEETARVVEEFKRDNSIEIFHVWHEDRGFRTSTIRNRAIARASGEYLIICDDDIMPSSRFTEDHLRLSQKGFFVQGHRALLCSRASEFFSVNDMNCPSLLKLFLKGEVKNIINVLRLPLPLIRRSQDLHGIRSCNMGFYREDLVSVNGFNEEFEGWGKEDSELAVRFYKYGIKRKDIKFRACCYHLYHEHYSRENLDRNVGLLEGVMKSDLYYCENGINKYIE